MKTSEAYAMAKQLNGEGKTHKEVAHALSRMGYKSRIGGKVLKPGSISTMLLRMESGYVPKDNRTSRYIGFKEVNAEKEEKPVKLKRVQVTAAKTTNTTTIWDIARIIDDSRVFSNATKKAILDLIVREAVSL